MIQLSEESFEKAREFLAKKGRRLEHSLFTFHFNQDENSEQDVIQALEGFQNSDGGFGHALEPDMRMNSSSVVATKFALQILIDINAPTAERLVREGIAYLLEQYDCKRKIWPLVSANVMDAPHAPWWNFKGLETEFGGFLSNPRAGILRCLLHYKGLTSRDFLEEIIDSLMTHFRKLSIEMKFFDAISFLQLLQFTSLQNKFRTMLLPKLKLAAKRIVSTDPKEWGKFSIKPLWLVPSPNAPLHDILQDDIQRNLDFEVKNQNEGGSWSPTWTWGKNYKDSWGIAETEWKGILTLAILRSLRDFDRIEGHPPRKGHLTYKYHID